MVHTCQPSIDHHSIVMKMRVARIALCESLGSSSRSNSRSAARLPLPLSSSRSIHHGAFQPTASRLDKGKRREDIKYDKGGVAHSLERQAYFAQSGSGSSQAGESGADWGSLEAETVGLEPGRVVECRRSVSLLLSTESRLMVDKDHQR